MIWRVSIQIYLKKAAAILRKRALELNHSKDNIELRFILLFVGGILTGMKF